MEYGLQLYSVRDSAAKDLETTVKKVAELGYSSVEFAGFFGRTPEQIVRMTEENNIKIFGSHSSFEDLVNDFDATVAFHRAIGNKNYIIPHVDLTSQEKIDYFVKNVNPIVDKLNSHGIAFLYHNHHMEFMQNSDGSVPYEQLLYRTDILFEVDTYWAFVGMKNPLELLKRMGGRVAAVHLKDGTADGHGFPLGKGEAPVEDVRKAVSKLNVPMIVESETCVPDGLTEAKICIDYLRKIEKQNA